MMMGNPEGPIRHDVLTWADVDKLIDLLIPQIRSVGAFDGMIMITRGGVIPGGMLSEALGIYHLLTAAVDFPAKAAVGLMAMPTFIQFPDHDQLDGRKLLIVDDVWGSGRTSISVRERVVGSGGTPFTCVLHFNPYRSLFTRSEPNFYGATTANHIVYPWEIDRGLRNIGMGVPEAN
jgi:hypoxanthine phosphoribosyltransferase